MMKPVQQIVQRLATAAILVAVAAACATPAQETPTFSDVTTTHLPADAEAHILDIDLGDVDGDGDLDAVCALEHDSNRLYVNDGTGRFTWRRGVFSDDRHDTEEVELADFDRDGHLDAVFIAEDGGNHELYLGAGDGTFREVSDRLLRRSVANDVEVADVDEDGWMDIHVSSTGNAAPGSGRPEWEVVRQNFLWLGDSERPGHFRDATESHLPSADDASQDAKFGDLDGDGDLDLVVGNEVPPNRLLLNAGDGTFEEAANRLDLLEPLETREVVLFDADGDDDLDILFANLTSNARDWDKNPQARLLINDGTARFTDETSDRMPTNRFSSYDAGALDFDGDGDDDLLLCAAEIPGFNPMQVRAYRNDGSGHFADVTNEVMPETTVGRCWDVEAGDVDADGVLDVLIGGWGTQARLLLGRR